MKKAEVETMLAQSERKQYNERLVEFVKAVVCAYYGKDISTFSNKSRKAICVKIRQVSMYLIMNNSKISTTDLGQKFGCDHSTVIHSTKTIKNYIAWDKELLKELEDLQKLINLKSKAMLNNLDLEKDFYYIDMNKITSFKLAPEKAILMVGFTEEETMRMKQLFFRDAEAKEHDNTGMYILEKINKDEKKDTNNS